MPRTTRAAVLFEVGQPLRIEELELVPPRPGEVLVRMQAAGICRSDWHVCTGDTPHPLPCALGHEGAGIVEAVGAGVTSLEPGMSVILSWAPMCGACFFCRKGKPALCETYTPTIWKGTMPDGRTRFRWKGAPVYHYCGLGCFSDYVVVPAGACVPMAPPLPPAIAALIGCAAATGVGAVLNTARVAAGCSAAVFGAGGIGLSALMALGIAGADPIIAVDTEARRERDALALGASHFLAGGSRATAAIRELTRGRGVDYAFDATGVPAVQEQCLEAVRPGGTAVLAGLAPVGSTTNLPGAVITRQEKTVTGSYYGSCVPERDFARIAGLYSDGGLDLDRLLTRTYPLREVNRAYADLASGLLARGAIVF